MIRSIRGLLAVTASAFVLAVAFAGAAQAVEFHAESEGKITGSYPKGEKGGEGEAFNFVTNGGIAPCFKMTAGMTFFAKTIPSLTLNTFFSECLFTTKMGACIFEFKASGTFAITGVTCATNPIEIVRGTCVIKFGPQEKESAITYENGGSGTSRDITATLKATKLHYVQTGNFCSGGVGTFTNGEITAKVTLKADTPEAVPQGLWIE
ncbi:MAG TPA: hypothetical protein VFI17_05745 [Solirubrobacterales bacterium]|nr:hypothetical protein [Solirubrobacterales bacterium]